MHETKSFCRLCIAACGTVLTVDNDRIVDIRGDRDHPISNGYICFKGLQAPAAHNDVSRQRYTLKRNDRDEFERIDTEQALDEIAAKLHVIIDRDGPEAVGLFRGTAGFHTSTAFRMTNEFLRALKSPSLFTTLTIDQSAKYIAVGRLGHWHSGQVHFEDADVALFFGSNPLISHSAGGFLVSDPVKRLRQARARGLKLIVVDPRETETAKHAEIFLQPYPGQDYAIAAGFLNVIFREGWHDAEFCARFVEGLDALQTAVEPFTPDYVAKRAGIDAGALRAAVELFAVQSKRGGTVTGTGPNMAPRSNLSEHLIQCITVVCGRFKREGDLMPNHDPLQPPTEWYAEVVAPNRPWENAAPSRIRGVGNLYGEKLTATLADEILTPGQGQIKALIIDGSNPGNSVPEKQKMIKALRALDLLVVIDPHITTTAEQADYIFSPKMQYERDDIPITLGGPLYSDAWTQYSPAVISPPADGDVIDDWYVFWSLAKRLNLPLAVGDVPLNMEQPPTSEQLLELGLRGSTITLDDIKQSPDNFLHWQQPSVVKPARAESTGRFAVAPAEIITEIAEVAAEPQADYSHYPFRLIARRMRDLNGSIGMEVSTIRQRNRFNPLHMNPLDIEQLGLHAGDYVEINSEAGAIRAIVQPDATLRHGVVSMSHNWGRADNDPASYDAHGASTNMLICNDRIFETINAMPRMSAIPVAISGVAIRNTAII
ncbi:MAG: nitrate reductase [Verrucomicrobiaceae bacterium]|nr:nitrate reductase [Verrucomicrobiaceae bacterium]